MPLDRLRGEVGVVPTVDLGLELEAYKQCKHLLRIAKFTTGVWIRLKFIFR